MDWMYSIAGFGVGLLVGMTGVGGGALMTPLLVLFFGQSPAVAVGTDLWFAAATKFVGGAVHQRQRSVDWQVLRRLCLGSLPAAVLTLLWLNAIGLERVQHGAMLTALGCVLLLTAVAMLFRRRVQAMATRLRQRSPERFRHAQPALTVLAGATLGVLVTLTSIGAGALGVVMLVCLYPLRLTPTRLVGTDIVHAIPLTVVAGSGHLWLGNVDGVLLGQLVLGSIPGVIIGARLTAKIPEAALRVAIALVLTAAAFKLLLR